MIHPKSFFSWYTLSPLLTFKFRLSDFKRLRIRQFKIPAPTMKRMAPNMNTFNVIDQTGKRLFTVLSSFIFFKYPNKGWALWTDACLFGHQVHKIMDVKSESKLNDKIAGPMQLWTIFAGFWWHLNWEVRPCHCDVLFFIYF